MQLRRLGRTRLMVSAIGFGGGVIGRWAQIPVLREAINRGVNSIDTAHKYGNGTSEKVIGEAIRGVKNRVYIATKTAERGAREAERNITESLQQLQIEKTDLLQMHAVGAMRDLARILDKRDGA